MTKKDDSKNPILVAVLSFIIPGLGQFYIGEKKALNYFIVAIATWVIGSVGVMLCLPALLPLAWSVVAAYDGYYAAIGKPEKKIGTQLVNKF